MALPALEGGTWRGVHDLNVPLHACSCAAPTGHNNALQAVFAAAAYTKWLATLDTGNSCLSVTPSEIIYRYVLCPMGCCLKPCSVPNNEITSSLKNSMLLQQLQLKLM